MHTASPSPPVSGRVIFRRPSFRAYWASRLASGFAMQIVSVAIGWQVYDLTRDPFDLGLVGLVQFLPALGLVLLTGTVADRFDRRRIFGLCLAAEVACTAALFWLTWSGMGEVWRIFVVLFGFGVARAFTGPAAQSLLPGMVPPEELSTAVAWNASAWQISTIVGPVAGGLLYGVSPLAAYAAAAVLFLGAMAAVALLPRPADGPARQPATWNTVVAGFDYVWRTKIVLGAISLDLFAVLLGGATALLPAYARDLLEVGPWGLGLLRAGPGIGAVVMAAYLAAFPIRDHAGAIMFAAVGVFGFATTVFGLSTVPWLSVAMLAVMGAANMVSVYVRETLIQLATPDAMRGRVNAVNMVSIGASNELGEFRAGIAAALIGVVPAVVLGGIGTMLVTGLWAVWFPQLRQARRLDHRF